MPLDVLHAHPRVRGQRLVDEIADGEVGSAAMWGSMPRPSNASMNPAEKKPLSPPRVVGVKPSRRLARCKRVKQPAVSDVTDRKIAVSRPRRIRCRFSIRALTV